LINTNLDGNATQLREYATYSKAVGLIVVVGAGIDVRAIHPCVESVGAGD